MPLFPRRPRPAIRRLSEEPIRAIPLAPGEARLLVTALQANDQLHREHFWTHEGSGWCRSTAESVLRGAGTAAALGQEAIPVLLTDLHMLGYTLSGLRQYAPRAQITADFAQLLNMMHAQSGMATVRNWQVAWSDQTGSLWWQGTPPAPVTSMGQIPSD